MKKSPKNNALSFKHSNNIIRGVKCTYSTQVFGDTYVFISYSFTPFFFF